MCTVKGNPGHRICSEMCPNGTIDHPLSKWMDEVE